MVIIINMRMLLKTYTHNYIWIADNEVSIKQVQYWQLNTNIKDWLWDNDVGWSEEVEWNDARYTFTITTKES